MPALLRSRLLLALLSIAALVPAVAACGGGSGGDPDADPAAVVPARAPVYLEADLSPDGEQADAVDELGRKLAGTEDVGAEIRKVIEREARKEDKDFSWEDDVESWLGDRAGIFFTSLEGDEAQGALVFPSDDPDKARDFFAETIANLDGGKKGKVTDKTYRDTEYKVESTEDNAVAVVGDYAVFGNEAGVKAAIDANEAEGLSEADAFKKARDQVPDDGLGFAYVGLRQLFSSLGPQAAALRPLLESAGDSVAIALTARPDAVQLDTASLGVSGPAGGGPGSVLGELPGDSWAALGTADIGGALERALQQFGQLGALGGVDVEEEIRKQTGLDIQRDLLSWMGDAGIFVMGDSIANIGGGLVVAVKDRARAVAAVPRLGRLAERFGELDVTPLRTGGAVGVRLRSSQIPVPIDMGVAGDKFIIAAGAGAFAAAASPDSTLADSAAFKSASGSLGDDFKPAFFLDFEPVRTLIGGLGLDKQGEAGKRASRALEALTTVVAGGRRDGDIARGRLVVGVK